LFGKPHSGIGSRLAGIYIREESRKKEGMKSRSDPVLGKTSVYGKKKKQTRPSTGDGKVLKKNIDHLGATK